MKINLLCGNNFMSNYINIDHRVDKIDNIDGFDFCLGYFNNLDAIIADNSCEKIFVSEPINIIEAGSAGSIIEHWKKKLNNNGILEFKFSDIYKNAENILGETVQSKDFNILFNGNKNYGCLVDLPSVKTLLKNFGFVIDSILEEAPYFTVIKARKVS